MLNNPWFRLLDPRTILADFRINCNSPLAQTSQDCLGGKGLRLTAAWAASLGVADISNVALLYRLRQCGDWLSVLAGNALSSACPKAAQGRTVRIVDATAVPKAGQKAKVGNGLWRLHCAFDLPSERFSHFELTDESEGERLDRIPVVKGEIRLADRAYLAAERIAAVIDAGGDIVVRAGWKNARWLGADGKPFDLIAALKKASELGKIDMPVWLGRKGAPALALRSENLLTLLRKRVAKLGRPPSAKAARFRTRPLSPPNGSSSSPRLQPKRIPRTMCLLFTACAGASNWPSSALRA